MQEGDPGHTAGTEVSAEAEMYAKEDTVPYISPQVLPA